MKRLSMIAALLFVACMSLSGCSGKDNSMPSESVKPTVSSENSEVTVQTEKESNTAKPQDDLPKSSQDTAMGVDVDLTQLSSTMVYSEVYNMMYTPEDYVGKIIQMSGQFNVYSDELTGANYYVVLIADATACCQQGMEFILEDDDYPGKYPEIGMDTTVKGTFELYDDKGTTYCHLINAEILNYLE